MYVEVIGNAKTNCGRKALSHIIHKRIDFKKLINFLKFKNKFYLKDQRNNVLLVPIMTFFKMKKQQQKKTKKKNKKKPPQS